MSKTLLSEKEILHLGKLANLPLSPEEVKKYEEQIGETLDYVENLKELDTSKADETHHTVDLKNVTFEDGQSNGRGLTCEEATANSHNKKECSFVVKRIL